MKKIIYYLLFIISVFCVNFPVSALTNDTVGPIIKKIELSSEEVSPGDVLKVTLTVTDESEIDHVRIIYNKGYNGTDDLGKSFYATKQEDGTYIGEIEITDKFYSDYYRISTSAIDIYGNYASQTMDAIFKVVGGIDDAVGPVIKKIELSSEEVSPGDVLKVTLTVTDESEIDHVRIIYNKGYNGTDDLGKSFYATKQEDGTYIGEIEITDKFYSDYYRISTGAIDIYGNYASQTMDAIFKVVGGIDDVVGPAIEKIELSKDTVSSGDVLKITLTVTDESEIDNVRIIYVKGEYINSSASKSFYATKQEDGTYVGEIEITDDFEIGKYKISTTARDIYGNRQILVQETNFFVVEKINKASLLNANTVSFKDNLSLNFLVELDESDIDGTFVKMRYKHYGEDKEIIVPINVNDKNGKYYRFRCPLTASEMMIPVTAELYLKDSIEPVSTFTRSIREYIIAGLNNSNASDAEKVLFRATLNYGGYTQKRFNYNGSPFAYDDYKDDISNINVSSKINFDRPEGHIDGIKYVGSSVFFRNAPYVRYYFELENGDNINDYTFKIGNNVIEPTKKDNRYYIESAPALAYQLDDEQNITVTKDNSDIMNFSYSVIKWAEIAVANTTNIDESNMAKAMYTYYLAAKDFVDSNS